MVTRNTPWPAGTPCWIDLGTDVAKAAEFYPALFGWRVEIGPEEIGGYSNGFLGDAGVCGISPLSHGREPGWLTYLASDDPAADAERAVALGATLAVEPMSLGEHGSLAVLVDPVGSTVGLWHAGPEGGATVVDEPGALSWNEHVSSDPEAAQVFYEGLFGYTFSPVDPTDPDGYQVLILPGGERPVGGAVGGGDPEHPAFWLPYLRVEDTDAAAAKVTELGGAVLQPPTDTPFGRFALVTDDQGARFKITTASA